jgi:hypothetical protein
VQVDDYLKYGVGTYKVEITNTGAGWKCTFVGYVELDGNPLTKPVGIAAVGFTALGAVGGLLAPRRAATPQWKNDQTAMYAKAAPSNPMDTILREGDKVIEAADNTPPPPSEPSDPSDPSDPSVLEYEIERATGVPYGCLGCVVGALLLPARAMPIVGMGGGAGVATATNRRAVGRVWRHGRPILGFFSGLVFGLGVSVLLWQYNVWLLTIVTAIVVPVVLGILFGIYAWLGRPYQVVAVTKAGSPAPTSDAPPPEVVADADSDPTEGESSPTA